LLWNKIVAGGKEFVEEVKNQLAAKANGSKVRPLGHGMELQDTITLYNAYFGPQNRDIDPKIGSY
jgi:hypothetical protein